ncbi:hypothetical protein ABVT39_003530 [Epinephelus coioides]
MNLRSGGASKDSAEIKFKENIKKEKSEKNAKGMVEKREIQQLFGELKDSLTKEFKELQVELKEFCQDTERDIKTIMQQTADLRNNLDLIVTRVDQLETRNMLLRVSFGGEQKYVRLSDLTLDALMKEVCLKFNIPEGRQPDMKVFDQSDTEVDGEVFEEIVKESLGTFRVVLSNEELDASLSSSSSCSAACEDTIILNFTMCDPPEEAAVAEGSQPKRPCNINCEVKEIESVLIMHEKLLLLTLPLCTVTFQEHFHAFEVTRTKQDFVVFHVDNLPYPRPFDIQMSYGVNDKALFIVPYCFIWTHEERPTHHSTFCNMIRPRRTAIVSPRTRDRSVLRLRWFNVQIHAAHQLPCYTAKRGCFGFSLYTGMKLVDKNRLKGLQAEIKKDFIALQNEVKFLTSDLKIMTDHVTYAEERISQVEERDEAVTETFTYLLQQQKKLTDRVDYLENKSRQLNIRITQWDVKQKVLHTAWAKGVINYQGSRIFFDHDFSTKLRQERNLYVPIRKQFKEKQLKSHVIYPSKFKVFTQNGIQLYATASEARQALLQDGTISGDQQHPAQLAQVDPAVPSGGWTTQHSRSQRQHQKKINESGLFAPSYGK